MRYLTLVAVMLFYVTESNSQTYEIGPYIGGANYIGDIGPTNYISPNTLVAGGVFKWNRSKRHAFRLSILHAKIQADDADSDMGKRIQRGFTFENKITEISLGIEYTFWEWNLHSFKPQFTPYLYTGITYFQANSLSRENRGVAQTGKDRDFSIPIVLGLKGSIGQHWVLAAEVGPRYTFSDDLDGLNPATTGDIHPNNNDWYVFTGISLTYTFGRKPCYCSF